MKKTMKKPEYMDMDRDGNKKEPMKQAMKKAPGRKASVKGRPTMKATKMPKRKTK
jgi:hypothetical protein